MRIWRSRDPRQSLRPATTVAGRCKRGEARSTRPGLRSRYCFLGGEGELTSGDGVAHHGADDLAADLLELDPDLLDLVAVGVLGVGHHEDAVDQRSEGQAVR